MTHRGPCQPQPFCDSVALCESGQTLELGMQGGYGILCPCSCSELGCGLDFDRMKYLQKLLSWDKSDFCTVDLHTSVASPL